MHAPGAHEKSNVNSKSIVSGLLLGLLCGACSTIRSGTSRSAPAPVTPNTSPEARVLLKFICGLSGQHTLTGQHNFPNTKDSSTLAATRAYGKVPAIFGQDFGFAAPGDKDAVSARTDIIAEVKRQHAKGSIVTLCWHAVPPTADEPVTFRPRRGETATNLLASVQGRLTDQQWNDLITPGTELNQKWCAQVDVIAGFLKQLQAAHIPVLWRPYHEMNGDWFWWGGRTGERGTKMLYRQIFDRLVNYHHLNNLIWIWSVDRPARADRQFVDYNPGTNYFDIAALDVYGSDFQQTYYGDLLAQAAGKPIALAEVGPPPAIEILAQQPRWTWWMSWAGNARKSGAMQALFNDSRSYSLSDPGFIKAFAPTRAAYGLPPMNP
jgi:mannan endo-1,4-beta-mannosidase